MDKIAPIKIGDNVYIGTGAYIMPGVTIGNNCIIGAGAIVTHDVPDNSVAVGVPAQVKYSIDEYYRKCKDKLLDLNSMTPDEKKQFLIKKFM